MLYLLLDPRQPSIDLSSAYELWLKVWSKTFGELGQGPFLDSDDFTRQDYVGALFDAVTPEGRQAGGECAGLSFFRTVDLSHAYARHDSYFSAWNAADLDSLCRHGSRILVSSYFTVAPEYRKTDVKHELMRNIKRVFENLTSADALCGTVRNDRGVNKLVYDHGFVPIRQGATMHGVPVDLTAYYEGGKWKV